MEVNQSYINEYLAEINLVLTQEDYGNKLYDLLSPIRNLLQKDEDLLSYSLARYCGANARLAFFCQWSYHSLKLPSDSKDLIEENREYWRKKVPLKLRGVPGLFGKIDKQIVDVFMPQQTAFFSLKSREYIDDLLSKYKYLNKYLNSFYLSSFLNSRMAVARKWYADNYQIKDYLDTKAIGTAFAMIALPCLLGFLMNFNQDDSHINPEKVRWGIIESILKQISQLYETANLEEFVTFVYHSRLGEKEEFYFLQLEEDLQRQQAMANNDAKIIADKTREKIFTQIKNDIDVISFPDKYKFMLKELATWAYKQ